MKETMKDTVLTIAFVVSALIVMAVVFISVGAFVEFVDYWNGTAKASLIKKQTGIEYTWREAAQIQSIDDKNNVRIIFSE